ncbi:MULTISPECIES: phage tail terminator protein [Acinetobacter]|uniref:Uncharacterized protein n=1 Tax=Acinetobacter kyonggiensis TaxID=595670 RepID=A0A1H3L899_9GAMM|nr:MULTISPECIES: hypothetical protein [Acinetobacter]CAD9195564.1 hypothetical protein QAC21B_01690 [Acinetobacter bohemicus]SDY60611.1 hypothetical protein SAMN05421643_11657 [Acinetobacter kyonggiensis]
MQSDYFALEPVIVERLKDIEGILAINTPFSIDDMLQVVNVSPSLNVIYVGDQVGESVGRGRSAPITQQWLVVLAVQDASAQLEETSNIRKIADPFIREILAKMQGFDPKVTGYRPFERVNAGVQVGSAAGFAYFPFLFESKLLT